MRGTSAAGTPIRSARYQILIVAVVVIATVAFGQVSIDRARSKLVVHTFKSGLFSAFAHHLEVEAPIAEGTVDEVAQRVNLVIDSRNMKVLDSQLPADKRGKLQERILGPAVLDSQRYPKISFESTRVQQIGQGQLLVRGKLFLHGVTRLISVKLRRENGRYVGASSLRQSEFGIRPITTAGGTVKVKDELQIEFDIRTCANAAGTGS
jgi:polyisoprenoid-binding protein YceI